MKLIDLQKQTANVSSAATITLGAALDKFRTVAQAIAAGDIAATATGVSFFVRDPANGAFESGEYTISNGGTTLTQTKRTSSSNNGQPVAFGGAACEVYSAAAAASVNALLSTADGVTASQLGAVATVAGLLALDASGNIGPATAAAVSAFLGATAAPPAGPSGAVQYPRMVDLAGSHAVETGPAPYDYVTDYNAPLNGLFDLGFVAGQDGSFEFDTKNNSSLWALGIVPSAKAADANSMTSAIQLTYLSKTSSNGYATLLNGVSSQTVAASAGPDRIRVSRVSNTLTYAISYNGGTSWTDLISYPNVTGAYKFQIITQFSGIDNVSGKGLA